MLRSSTPRPHPYVRLPSPGGDSRPRVSDAPPVGFKRAVRPAHVKDMAVVTADAEQAECHAYLEDQKWLHSKHAAWQAKCRRRRARQEKLELHCLEVGLEAAPLKLPLEPAREPVRPACVDRYVAALKALPAAKRAVQCRTGHGGHAGLSIARQLVLLEQRAEFEAADLAKGEERQAAMEIERERISALEEEGPNGETGETHERVVATEPFMGKGTTRKVVHWVRKE